MRKIRYFVFCLILIFTSTICSCFFKPKVVENTSIWVNGQYEELSNTSTQNLELFIIKKEEVGRYTEANFYIAEGRNFFKYAEYAYSLQLTYEETEYLETKENLFNQNIFLKTISFRESDKEIRYDMPIIECNLGNYQIKVLDLKKFVDKKWDYLRVNCPRFFGIIAFNDEMYTIRYCYLSSSTLDFFWDAESCIDYIENSVGLQW